MAKYNLSHSLNTSKGFAYSINNISVGDGGGGVYVPCLVNTSVGSFIAWHPDCKPTTDVILHVKKNGTEYVVCKTWWLWCWTTRGVEEWSERKMTDIQYKIYTTYTYRRAYATVHIFPTYPDDISFTVYLSYKFQYYDGYNWKWTNSSTSSTVTIKNGKSEATITSTTYTDIGVEATSARSNKDGWI